MWRPRQSDLRSRHAETVLPLLVETGDSLAVLGRGGRALKLTMEHKPHQPGERERIERKGGRVNVERERVYSPLGRGALNMSRRAALNPKP
jgi:serine/threonine protein phosphatase PrpC